MDGNRPSPLSASLAASLAATVSKTISKAMTRAVLAAMPARAVACPYCGRIIAALAHRRLYRPRTGQIGPPLATDSRGNAPVTCDHCRVTWRKSPRAVAYALRAGRPPLPLEAV
jgi:hypothetical protein